jgi:DNA-binding transcriptional ArsR family regulator
MSIEAVRRSFEGEVGEVRRKIVLDLATHPHSTAYQVAKRVFGDGVKFHRKVEFHLGKLKQLGIVESKRMRGRTFYSVTSGGRAKCLNAGLPLPAEESERLLNGLSLYAVKPLPEEKVEEGRMLLTEGVIDTLKEALQSFSREYLDGRRPLELDPWTLCIILNVFEGERALYRSYMHVVERLKGSEKAEFKEWLKREGFKDYEVVEETLEDPSRNLLILRLVESRGLEEGFGKLVEWFNGVKESLYPHRILELYGYLSTYTQHHLEWIIDAYSMFEKSKAERSTQASC